MLLILRFLFIFLIPIPIFAIELARDDFYTNLNGWTGSNIWHEPSGVGWLGIGRDAYGEKTYFGGSFQPNQSVEVTFRIYVPNDWETDDDFNVFINGSLAEQYSLNDGYSIKTFSTTTDNLGRLKIRFNPDTSQDSKDAYIDYVVINSSSPTITISDVTEIEGDSGNKTFTIPVTLSPTATSTVTVDYTTANNTATSSSDYVATSGTLTFNAGETTKNISVTVIGDTSDEGDESFYINLSNISSGADLGDNQALITISNDDGPAYSSGEVAFYRINPEDTKNIIGNTLIVGNTSECLTQYYHNNYGHLYPSSLTALKSGTCQSDLAKNDNNYFTRHIDIDSDSTTFNSSSSTLIFPTTYKEIAWAGLFWQGHVNNDSYQYNDSYWHMSSDKPSNIESSDIGRLKLKVGNGNYQDVSASRVDYFSSTNDIQYSAFADVTSMIDSTVSSNTVVTVANVASSIGLERSLGNYGAWTLVIVYKEDGENANSKLRNNSVYYGYKQISSGHDDEINITDFLLPKKGVIDSQMAVFAAEGEYTYYPDTMQLDGTSLGATTCSTANEDPSCQTNIFDAKISPSIKREPSLTNNNGIDIDVFDTSAIMTTKRDNEPDATNYSSKISLTSDWDMYFPSMVSFVTELYRPRVCYYIESIVDDDNTTVFADRAFKEEIEVGKNYHFNLWISNMKKNSTDTDIEDAKLVQVYVKMKDGFEYKTDSTWIKNIGTSHTSNDGFYEVLDINQNTDNDVGDFHTDNNTSYWRVGDGATDTQGGSLEVASSFSDDDKKAFVKLEGTFNLDDNATTFDLANFYEFTASFQTDSITIGANASEPIYQCVDLDTAGSIRPIGAFNVVNANFSNSSMLNDQTASSNALYTQVVGQPFSVKILSLGSEGQISTPLKTISKTVGVSVVDGTQDCDTADVIQDLGDKTFNNESILSFDNITINTANPQAMFRINDGGEFSCSLDFFAIRPDTFDISISGASPHIAGEAYDITFSAIDTGGSAVTTYTDVQGTNFSVDINETISGCTTGTFTPNLDSSWYFIAGTKTFSGVTYSEVGSVKVDIAENVGDEYAKIDFLDTADSDRLITPSSTTLTFTPDHFQLTPTLTAGGNNYTYLSNDLNMSLKLSLDIEAQNKLNAKTANYNAACYAKTTDYNVTYANTTLQPANAITNIVYQESETGTNGTQPIGTNIVLNGIANTIFDAANPGEGSVEILINYDRNSTKVINPFSLTINDINITDADGVTGTSNPAATSTFYYGRVYAPDQTFNGDNGNAQVYYEVYCVDCNRTSLNIAGGESVDSINWFQNTLHVNLDGNVTRFESIGNVRFGGANYANADNNSSTVLINQGNEQQLLRINTLPYIDRITYTPHPWLVFNPSNPNATTGDFMVEFTSRGGWGGEGSVDQTDDNNTGIFIHDQNITTNQIQKRMDW